MNSVLEAVKLSLRIKAADFDDELQCLINGCMKDLNISGVNRIDESDALIRRAATLYCKANFGNIEHADRYSAAYDMLKKSLALAGDYRE